MSPRRKKRPVKPRLPVHAYAGQGICCHLPEANLVHDLTRLPATPPEAREAEARRIGESEEPV
jgi:hypothetical protein